MGGKGSKQKKKEGETPNADEKPKEETKPENPEAGVKSEAAEEEKNTATGETKDVEKKDGATEENETKPAESEVSTKVSTQFKWEGEGESIEVGGSFNSWEKVKLEKTENVFTVSIDLEPGEYLYKYIVDGEWKISNSQATKAGDDGIENNFIEVKKE